MIFKILRASDYSRAEKPCTTASLCGDEWTIDLSTIEQLDELTSEVGSIVVNGDEIIIYDDYIE